AGGDGVKVRLWDAATGELLREVKAHYAIDRSVALSADGKLLAATDGVGLRLWDAATGKDLLDDGAPRGLVAVVAFAPDGRALAPAAPGRVRVGDVRTGRPLRAFPDAPGRAERFEIGGADPALSPAARLLVSATEGGALRVVEVGTGKELHRLADGRE